MQKQRGRTASILGAAAVLAAATGLSWETAAAAPAAPAADAPALDLAPHRGRVVVVDFWASWCRPCRAELPWLADLQARLGPDGLTVLTVNLDEERRPAEKLLADLKLELPVVWDPAGELARRHRLEGMPTSLFYGRGGELRATHLGFEPSEAEALESELRALLAEPPQERPAQEGSDAD